MAIIPRYSDSEIQTSNLPSPRAQGVGPAAFGAGLASGLDTTADVGFAVAKHEKAKADSANVAGRIAESQNFSIDYLTNPETGLLNKKGKDAIGIEQKALQDFDKRTGEILKTLTNDTQRRAFVEHTAEQRNNFMLQVNRHERKETEEYHISEADALVNSQLKELSLNYQDPKLFNQGIDKLKQWTANASRMRGMGTEAAKEMEEKALSAAYADRIEQTLNDPRNPDPSKANTLLEEYGQHISPHVREQLQRQIKPKMDAYQVDGILSQVNEQFKDADPMGDYGIDKRYEAAKSITKDPHVRDLVYKELERGERLHNQSVKDTYDAASGHIFMVAREDWNNQQPTSVKKIMQLPEFAKLSEKDQERVLDKVDTENRLMAAEKNRKEMEQRRLASDERRNRNEERRAAREDKREHDRQMKERWDATFNHYNVNPEELAQMSKSEFEALAAEVSHADYKKLTEMKKKLQSPQAISHAVIEADTLNNILLKSGITDPAEIKKYGTMAKHYIAVKQKEAGRQLTPEETTQAVIGGLQRVAVNTSRASIAGIEYGDRGEIKRRMEVQNPSSIIIPPDINRRFDDLEKKRGIKLDVKRRRMLYDEMLAEGK